MDARMQNAVRTAEQRLAAKDAELSALAFNDDLGEERVVLREHVAPACDPPVCWLLDVRSYGIEMANLMHPAEPCRRCGASGDEPCHTPDGPPRADGTGLMYHGRPLARRHAGRAAQ